MIYDRESEQGPGDHPDHRPFSLTCLIGTKRSVRKFSSQITSIDVQWDLKHKEFFLAKHLIDKPDNLEDGGPGVPVSVEGRQIALYEFEGSIYAVDNRCPHRGGPMADGPVSGPTITCPLHSWSFDMRSGEAVGRPGATIACFAVSKDPSGKIAVEIA